MPSPLRLLLAAALLSTTPGLCAEPPRAPLIRDTALKVELFAGFPEIEATTTVAAGPDGAVYIGNDPRDGHLNTKDPECTITRFADLSGKKKTVFAKGLYSPAGSLWHEGWLYVIHDPLLSRFKDTDGDGVADVREDLVWNLGPQPHEGLNDHVVSGFTLGMDGFFYISVGDKGVYHTTGMDKSEVTLQGGGIIRCRPDGTGLEVFSGGTRNHLEVDLDAMDHAFTLDNTDDGNGWWTRLTHHIESGYYGYPFNYKNDQTNGLLTPGPQKPQFWPGAPAVNERFLPAMTDFGGGSPCGGLCYLSDGLPEAYRGKLLFSEWGKAKLSVIEVAPEGASFRFVKNEPLLEEEKGGSFRPMQVTVAADGSLLIADWGYGGWKSPKQVGALWRVSWPEAKPKARLRDESKASVPELIAALDHPDRDQRLRAEWALVRRGESVIPALIETMNNVSASDVQRAHALWTLDLLGEASPELRSKASGLIRQLLADKSDAVRTQAVRALGVRSAKGAATEIETLVGKSQNSELLLQAAIALGRMGTASAAVNLAASEDRWVRFAARAALVKAENLAALQHFLLAADGNLDWSAAAREKGVDVRMREQAWLAYTSALDKIAVHILTLLASAKDPRDQVRALEALGSVAYMPAAWDGHWWGTQPVKSAPPLPSVVWEGTAPATTALSTALGHNEAQVRLAAAQALSHSIGQEALPALRTRLAGEQDPAVRRQLIETLGVQKDPEALAVFSTIALDEKADADFRDTAILAVANIGGDAAKQTMAKLASAELSPAATLRVVQSVGEMRLLEAAPAIMRHATSPDTALRLAVLKSLHSLGAKADALDVFTAALLDKDGAVLNAALEALTSLHDPRALPALLEVAKKYKGRREYIVALASIPDPQTIPLLLDTLRGNDNGLRRAALVALKKMRAQSRPLLDEMIAAGKIPVDNLPEIKNAFESGFLAKWKVLGPFENVWGAMHPPETEALAANGTPDLKKKYVNAEGNEVGWRDATGSEQDGRVDLGKLFKNNGMICAYAYAEINATADGDAVLFGGSDDQLALWLNGKKLYDSGPGSRGFDPDTNQVPIHLQAGVNRLFAKVGNVGGDWVFAARVPGLDGMNFTPSTEPAPDVKQRTFALATKADGAWLNAGDAKRGEGIFSDQGGPLNAICITCHAARGKGGQIGPDLTNVGTNYKRPDLITSIQEPSKTIALGFEQFAVETKGGETFVGAIRQETGEGITIIGGDGQPHIVKKADEKARTPIPISLMPPGLTLGLKPQEFADLLAYLESLKGQ